MKPELLRCAAAFCCLCSPKAQLLAYTLLNSKIKTHKIRTRLGLGVECLLLASEITPPAPFCSEFMIKPLLPLT